MALPFKNMFSSTHIDSKTLDSVGWNKPSDIDGISTQWFTDQNELRELYRRHQQLLIEHEEVVNSHKILVNMIKEHYPELLL